MKFAVIGAGGYVARKHVDCIYKLGHEVTVVCDPAPNMGWLDSHDMGIRYEPDPSNFFRLAWKLGTEWCVVCTPNYMHTFHAIEAVKWGMKVILEKPTAVGVDDLEMLLDKTQDATVAVMLQIRYNPQFKEFVRAAKQHPAIVNCTYHTPRGAWYDNTWKMDEQRSGGLIFNIGIHMLDAVTMVLGNAQSAELTVAGDRKLVGDLSLDYGVCHFDLDIRPSAHVVRKLTNNIETLDMSAGFTARHLEAYQHIIGGDIITPLDTYKAIEAAEIIRKAIPRYNENGG